MTFFFWSTPHFRQEISHLKSDDLFFSFGLHFIALYCGGQKFRQPRGVVKFSKSSSQFRKMAKNGQFCRIIPLNAQHRFAPLINTNLFHNFKVIGSRSTDSRLSGSVETPKIFFSVDNHLLIKFESDRSTATRGFSAKFLGMKS